MHQNQTHKTNSTKLTSTLSIFPIQWIPNAKLNHHNHNSHAQTLKPKYFVPKSQNPPQPNTQDNISSNTHIPKSQILNDPWSKMDPNPQNKP